MLKRKKLLPYAGNPAAEGTGYFFINKISKFPSFIVLGGLKCEKLANNVRKVIISIRCFNRPIRFKTIIQRLLIFNLISQRDIQGHSIQSVTVQNAK